LNDNVSADSEANIELKKNYAAIVNNSKCTYTLWNGEGSLETVAMTGDSENLGMFRSLLRALRTSKKQHIVDEGFKELSFVYEDPMTVSGTCTTNIAAAGEAANNKTGTISATATNPRKRPSNHKLFYNYLPTLSFASGTKTASVTIYVPFCDIFEGLTDRKFLNCVSFDAQVFLQDISNWIKPTIGSTVVTNTNKYISSVFITDCSVYFHSYVTSESDFFSIEDTKLSHDQIMIKSFHIPQNQMFFTERCIYNFPCKYVFIVFTPESNDFSELLPVQFSRLSFLMSGAQKRTILPMYENDGVDNTLFEYLNYIVNTNNEDDYETLLNYNTYRDQFRIVAIPCAEWWNQASANQLSFEIDFKNDGTLVATNNHNAWYMHMIFIRSD